MIAKQLYARGVKAWLVVVCAIDPFLFLRYQQGHDCMVHSLHTRYIVTSLIMFKQMLWSSHSDHTLLSKRSPAKHRSATLVPNMLPPRDGGAVSSAESRERTAG